MGEANTSDKPGWSITSCYNSLSNRAYNNESIFWKESLQIAPDNTLIDVAVSGASPKGGFLQKEKGPALKETEWEKEVVTKLQG